MSLPWTDMVHSAKIKLSRACSHLILLHVAYWAGKFLKKVIMILHERPL